MSNPILATEHFSNSGRHIYVDCRLAVNNRHYLNLACVDEQREGARSGMRIFQNELPPFIQAVSSVLHHAAYRLQDIEQQGNLFQPPKEVQGIKSWQPECRPREKLMLEGREIMSDAELLAMLICAGLPGVTAVDLAEQVLKKAGNDLKQLAALKAEDLMKIRGIGHARALSVIAAMELAVRLAAREQPVHFLKLINGAHR